MLLAVGQQHERHGLGQHGDDRRVTPDSPVARGSGVRVSTHITSSVSAPRAHRPNATHGGATPASSATLIKAKLEPQTAERSTKPGSQASEERAGERVIDTALASGRDRRRSPVVPPTGPAAGGPVGGGPGGRRGHLGPGRDGRRGARSGAAVRVVDGGGRRRLHPRPGDGPARPPPRLRRGPRAPAAAGHRGRATARDRRRPRPRAVRRCAVPACVASASSPSWSSPCSRSPACTGAGCSCPLRRRGAAAPVAQWAPTLPDEAGTSVALLRPPHHPSRPPALHGRAVVHLRYTHVGRPAEAEALLAPLRAVATPLHDDVRERPITDVDAVHRHSRHPTPDDEGSVVLRELPAEAVDALLAAAGRTCPRRWTWWSCGRWAARWSVRRGAQRRRGRGAAWSVWVRGPSVPGESWRFRCPPGPPVTATSPTRSAVPAAATRVIDALAPWSLGGALPNFAGAKPPGALWSRVDRSRLRCSRPSTRTACSPGPRCPDWPDSLHGRRAGTVGARVVRAVASPAGAGRPAAAARPARSHRCRAPRPSARCR